MTGFSLTEHRILPSYFSHQAWPAVAIPLVILLILGLFPQCLHAEEQATAAGTEPLVVTHKPEVFAKLWKVYPNKEGKEAAIQAWNDLKVSDEDLNNMRAAYPRWRFSAVWMQEKGKHVPPLAQFLSERMWEKPPPPPAPAPPLHFAEASSFLIQPIYLVPRLAFAVSGVIVAGVVWPFDNALGHKVWDTSIGAPWVWHELWKEPEESSG